MENIRLIGLFRSSFPSTDMTTVIKVENLSKRYIIGHRREASYGTLRDSLTEGGKSLARRLLHPFRSSAGHAFTGMPDTEEFWALKGISFDVQQGDRIGILGRNGAGKTTLLKILSRITEPTEGRASIRGRISSLLEVGTGFHPELTGRENIFLNGAILGMGREEIRGKFDEIVAFAEVEKFLDTPVKRYSSGMYVRLAFAVAAHLEPEILVVDEVLAVGDAAFQKKCLGKMEDVSREGRTILFVSHNMGAIRNLCRKAVWLHGGRLERLGTVEQVISDYLLHSQEPMAISLDQRRDRKGTGDLRCENICFYGRDGREVQAFTSGQTAKIVFHLRNRSGNDLRNVHLSMGIDDQAGQRITLLDSEVVGQNASLSATGDHRLEVTVDRLPLIPGRYGFTIYCAVNGVVADWIQNAGSFEVISGPFFDTGKMPPPGQGNFLLDCSFRHLEPNDRSDG